MSEEQLEYSAKLLADKISLEKEIERLNKELEYSDFCNKQLRDTIANLEYKTKRLEEDLKELKGSDKE